MDRVMNLYHKWIYRPYAFVVTNVVDLFPFALSDLVLWMNAFPLISLTVSLSGLLAWINFSKDTVSGEVGSDEWKVVGAVFLAVMAPVFLFMVLSLRKPYYKRLELSAGEGEVEIDLSEDLEWLIREINILGHRPVDDHVQYARRVSDTVARFLAGIDGYKTRGNKRFKYSIWGDRMIKGTSTLGICNPFILEPICFFRGHFEVGGHEIVHSFGIPREADAIFVQHAAGVGSSDPVVRYWAFYGWMSRIVDLLPVDSWDETEELLSTMGLNSDTLGYWRETEEQIERLVFERDDKFKASKSKGLLSRFVHVVSYAISLLDKKRSQTIHKTFVKATGQKGTHHAYYLEPLTYLSLYRRANFS
jgi:hypothetical protein